MNPDRLIEINNLKIIFQLFKQLIGNGLPTRRQSTCHQKNSIFPCFIFI